MTVLTFKEIHNGRDGGDDISRGTDVRRYTHVHRAVTDDADDDATVVLDSAPLEGAPHPVDPQAWLQRRSARNESFSKTVWLVTLNYSTERELSDNPLLDPVQVSWDTESFQEIAVQDIYGNAILNSAGDIYDPPPEKDDGRWTVSTSKNVAVVPSWLLSYRQAINSAPFILDGITIATRVAKIQSIHISSAQRRNDIPFRVVTIRLQLKEEQWKLVLLDRGFHEKAGGSGCGSGCHGVGSGCGSGRRRKIFLCDCEEPVTPVLLNGSGIAICDPNIYNGVFRTHYIYNEKDFSVLPLT